MQHDEGSKNHWTQREQSNSQALSVALTPLASRIRRYYEIDDSEISQLENVDHDNREYQADDAILERGDPLKSLLLMVSGWAARCRYTQDGERQIVHLLLPGDLVTPSVFVVQESDHEIIALTKCDIRTIEPEHITELFAQRPKLAAALWWTAEQEHGMLREQIVRLGRRSALASVAHLLLELHERLIMVDQTMGNVLVLPLSQHEIADLLGLSAVHINRTLKKLERSSLISYQGRLIELIDVAKLAEMSDFDTKHLHLNSTASDAKFGA